MYQNTEAQIRPELAAVVEEAAAADQYFIAQQVFPVYPVATKYGEYRRIKKGSGQLLASELGDSNLRAPKTPYKEITRTYEKDGYRCRDRGLIEVVDDSDSAELARFLEAEQVSAKLVQRNMAIAQEKRVADLVMDNNIWGKVDATVNYTNTNLATIDAPKDIEDAISRVQKRGEMVNTIVMTRDLWKLIRRSTLMRKYIFGEHGGGQMISRDVFAQAFSESASLQVLIAESTVSTKAAPKAVADADISYVWSSDYIWVGHVAADEPSAGGAGRIMVWQEDADSLYVVETYRDEQRRSDVVRVRQHTDEKVINENSGTLIKTNFA